MNIEGMRLLLVEDEAIIGFALDDMLAEHGAVTTLVPSVEAGRRSLAAGTYDAAIVDVNLNGEYSYPLAAEIIAAGCPVVFATGYGDVTHPADFAATPTVEKPYSLASLVNALETAIANGRG